MCTLKHSTVEHCYPISSHVLSFCDFSSTTATVILIKTVVAYVLMSDVQLILYQTLSQHGEKKCCLSINVFKSSLLLS